MISFLALFLIICNVIGYVWDIFEDLVVKINCWHTDPSNVNDMLIITL